MLTPHATDPHEVGVPEEEPDVSLIEGARILADEATPLLRPAGFTPEQVREWADAYLAEEGPGDVERFVAWVRRREERGTRTG
jgi:hypothetical protein